MKLKRHDVTRKERYCSGQSGTRRTQAPAAAKVEEDLALDKPTYLTFQVQCAGNKDDTTGFGFIGCLFTCQIRGFLSLTGSVHKSIKFSLRSVPVFFAIFTLPDKPEVLYEVIIYDLN
jgi:hypothetical protein